MVSKVFPFGEHKKAAKNLEIDLYIFSAISKYSSILCIKYSKDANVFVLMDTRQLRRFDVCVTSRRHIDFYFCSM